MVPMRNTSASVPERLKDLLSDEVQARLYLATLMPDGTPQVTPVWFNYDGEYLWINSVYGRVKDRNMRARPHVACLIADPHDPYRYVQIRGEVIAISEEGALEHKRAVARKYGEILDEPITERRVMYKIRLDKVYPPR